MLSATTHMANAGATIAGVRLPPVTNLHVLKRCVISCCSFRYVSHWHALRGSVKRGAVRGLKTIYFILQTSSIPKIKEESEGEMHPASKLSPKMFTRPQATERARPLFLDAISIAESMCLRVCVHETMTLCGEKKNAVGAKWNLGIHSCERYSGAPPQPG